MKKKKVATRTNWKKAAEYWHQYAVITSKQVERLTDFQDWAMDAIEKLMDLVDLVDEKEEE